MDVQDLARRAGFIVYEPADSMSIRVDADGYHEAVVNEPLKRFAALVLEEAARQIEDLENDYTPVGCAAQIRALIEPPGVRGS